MNPMTMASTTTITATKPTYSTTWSTTRSCTNRNIAVGLCKHTRTLSAQDLSSLGVCKSLALCKRGKEGVVPHPDAGDVDVVVALIHGRP